MQPMLWGQGSPHRPSAAGCVGRGGATERGELWDKMSRSELSEVCADESQSAGFGEAPQQAFSRDLRPCENGLKIKGLRFAGVWTHSDLFAR